MFITYLSITCFGAYGHPQVDELTKNTHKQLHLACVFYTEDGGGVIGWGYCNSANSKGVTSRVIVTGLRHEHWNDAFPSCIISVNLPRSKFMFWVREKEICPNWIRVQQHWFPACFTAAYRRVRSDLLYLLAVGTSVLGAGLRACSVWIKDLSIVSLSGGTWLACRSMLLQNICVQ